MTNWTDKQDAEVGDNIYTMRADGTMSNTGDVIPRLLVTDSPERSMFNLMCYGCGVLRLPREGHERPKT